MRPGSPPAGSRGGTPGDRRDDQDRKGGDGHQTDAEDDQVYLHARIRFGQAGRPDRHQRRRRHGDHDGGAAAGRGHHARTRYRQPEQLPPAGPQGAQDGIIRSAGDQLAAQQLADDDQDGQAGQRGEQRQRVRLRLDRLLDLGLLISEVEHLDTLGRRVMACQPGRLASKLRHIGSRLQAHERLFVGNGKRPALVAAVERGCQLQQGEWSSGVTGTIWLSNTTTPATRNRSRIARPKSALPPGPVGAISSRSTLPGRRP